MIPKKIHYIWLGGRNLTQLSHMCINTWKEKLPEYEIIEWNEKNLDLDKIAKENRFFAECRKRNLYAYMADYLRLRILYKEGGIYMDTDIQVVKPFEDLVDTDLLIGHASYGKIGTGFIGCEKGSPIIKRLLKFYEREIWDLELYIIPDILEYVFKKEKYDLKIYPKEYFSPVPFDQDFRDEMVTENTRVIHWYEGSWKLNKHVAVFLSTKHIKSPVKKKYLVAKRTIGFYLRKYKIIK